MAPARSLDATALVLVDIQQGLAATTGPRNNADAEERAGALLRGFRRAGAPRVHVQHLSVHAHSRLRPDLPGVELHSAVAPQAGEPLFQKSSSSPFVDTPLEVHLREHGIRRIVVAGLTTEHCVSSTCRAASDRGFQVTVVDDATACFGRTSYDGRYHAPDEIHRLALVALHDEFATIMSTAQLLAELGGIDAPSEGSSQVILSP